MDVSHLSAYMNLFWRQPVVHISANPRWIKNCSMTPCGLSNETARTTSKATGGQVGRKKGASQHHRCRGPCLARRGYPSKAFTAPRLMLSSALRILTAGQSSRGLPSWEYQPQEPSIEWVYSHRLNSRAQEGGGVYVNEDIKRVIECSYLRRSIFLTDG